MALEAASLLDQLMGTTRNAVPGENVKELTWSDEEVCKHYLCGFCPSVLFINTKAEATVGSCYKVHDERLRKAYEERKNKDDFGYEDMFLGYLERLVRDLDRKVERGKERLRRSAQAKQRTLLGDGPGGCSSEKLKRLNRDIDMLVEELDQLGRMGRVEETHELMIRLEVLEKERESERLALSNAAPKVLAGFEVDSNDFHEKMELCDVCGSFLVIGDTQSRVDAHLLGKQHIGFARIRTAIADLKLKKEERYRAKQQEMAQHREQGEDEPRHRRPSQRDRSRERRRSHRSRSHDKHHRERRRHSRRSRSRERRHSRSRSRDRRPRSKRSRERQNRRLSGTSKEHRQSRSRSRERKKSMAKDRSCSKSRSRSQSRERSRSKSAGERNGDN